jgi:hypothetical protein
MSLEHDLVRKVASALRANERVVRELGAVLRGYEVLLAEAAHALHDECNAAGQDEVRLNPTLTAHQRLALRIDRLLARRAPDDPAPEGSATSSSA